MYKNCSQCTSCGFAKVPRTTELAHKDLMVVGDAPTAIEVRNNKIMQGPAVDILKQTMKKVGLPSSEHSVYYTTALKCAVPKRKGKAMPITAFRNCRDHLLEEIKIIQPKIVIVLGKYATQCIFNDFKLKITSVYGRVSTIEELGDIKIIPIIHPAMLIRSPGEYKPFLSSLQLIKTVFMGKAGLTPEEVNWTVIDTDEKWVSFLNLIKEKHAEDCWLEAGCDIETTSLDYREAEFCVLGIAFENAHSFVIPRSMRHHCVELFELLQKYKIKCIWHHGKYDSKVMWRRNLGIIPHDEDTIYQHYVLDETSAHDLGSLTKIFLQAPDYKFKMNQNFKAVTLDTYESFLDSLCERVAVDCCYTLQLFHKFNDKLNQDKRLGVLYHNLIMPAARFLSRVERNGMYVNPQPLQEMDKTYQSLLAEIKREIQETADAFWDPELYKMEMQAKSAGVVFNPGSPKQMSWMVFKRLKLKPRIRKGMSTSADVLNSIEPTHPLVDLVLKYRGVKKEHSTYVLGLLKARDVDGRVRSTFSLHVTATGRLSSKEPNVQNIPSYFGVGNVRRAFKAPEGKILMECDYSGAELRWLACLSGDKILKRIFQEGRNLHDETSRALFGPNFTKQDRMRAKAVNFGIPYGREARSLADEFNIPIEEAQLMIDNWLNAYPGAKAYLARCANIVTQGGYLETPFYRRRRVGLVTPESLHGLQNEARNMPIQSSSSDTLLVSAMVCEKRLREEFDTKIINLIHDSMLLEVPKDKQIIHDVGKYVTTTMIDMPVVLFNLDIPFAADIDLGPTWGDFGAYDLETQEVTIKKNKKEINLDVMEFLDSFGDTVNHA